MAVEMSRFERNGYVVRMRRVCAAGRMRCPDGRCLFRVQDNPLLRADEGTFVSVPEGGCALTGRFGPEGFFAAPCAASGEAAEALLRAVLERQRAWGAARVTGPVSPSIVDFSVGAALGEPERASAFSEWLPSFFGPALARLGFSVCRRSILYEMGEACDRTRYERVAAYSMARFGYRVASARDLGDRAACEAMAHVSRDDPAMARTDAQMAALLSALGRRWSRPMTQIALHGGEPVGYLLAVRAGQTARAATAQVRRGWRNRAVTAALALAMLRAARGLRAEFGVVGEDNAASRFSLERAGARPTAYFQQFSLKLTEK